MAKKQVEQKQKKSKNPKLTREEKKKLNTLIVKHNNKKEISAQKSIPYEQVYKDGICKVDGKLYSKTILFDDINYQLAENEDKTSIFESWCNCLNYFDTSIKFQLTFLNIAGNEQIFEDSIHIETQDDDFNSIREEYTDMLKRQLSKGNNGVIKQKYLTFSIEADSLKKARTRLDRIEIDIYNNFKKLGVNIKSLDGKERLNLFHNILHMDTKNQFSFDWD